MFKDFKVGDRIIDRDGDYGTVVLAEPGGTLDIRYDFQTEEDSDPYHYRYDEQKSLGAFLRVVQEATGRLPSQEVRVPPLAGEVRVTDPKTGGQKGQKQEQYSMIPVEPLAEVARVYGYGAQKYDRDNWRKGYAWSLSLDALLRHIEQFRRGESVDTESGRQHLAHAAFHLFTLMEYDSKGLGTDDRGDLPQSVNRGGSPQTPQGRGFADGPS